MAIDQDEYLRHIKSFCDKHECDYTVFYSVAGNRYVYDSVEAMLATRIVDGKVETEKGNDGKTDYALLSRKNFDKYELKDRLEDKFSITFDTETFRCEMYNFRTFVNNATPFGGIAFKSVKGEEGTNIYGHLTYDGLCAYLALAPNEDLLANWQYLSKEITRNAVEEIPQEEVSRENWEQEVIDIGNKYLELHCVSRAIFDRAQEQIGGPSESQEQDYNLACEFEKVSLAQPFEDGESQE